MVGFGGAFVWALIAFAEAPALVAVISGGIIGGLVSATWMTKCLAVVWERNGGRAMARALQVAIRRRELPPELDRQEWRWRLAAKKTALRRARWFNPVFFFGAASLYLTAALTDALPALGYLPWFGVLLFAGFGIYSPFATERELRGAEALEQQLSRREADESLTPAPD